MSALVVGSGSGSGAAVVADSVAAAAIVADGILSLVGFNREEAIKAVKAAVESAQTGIKVIIPEELGSFEDVKSIVREIRQAGHSAQIVGKQFTLKCASEGGKLLYKLYESGIASPFRICIAPDGFTGAAEALICGLTPMGPAAKRRKQKAR